MTLDDAVAIRAALEESGSVSWRHNQLFQPSLIEARRLLAGGAGTAVHPLHRGGPEPRFQHQSVPSSWVAGRALGLAG